MLYKTIMLVNVDMKSRMGSSSKGYKLLPRTIHGLEYMEEGSDRLLLKVCTVNSKIVEDDLLRFNNKTPIFGNQYANRTRFTKVQYDIADDDIWEEAV